MLATPSFLFGMNTAQRGLTKKIASKYPTNQPSAAGHQRTKS